VVNTQTFLHMRVIVLPLLWHAKQLTKLNEYGSQLIYSSPNEH